MKNSKKSTTKSSTVNAVKQLTQNYKSTGTQKGAILETLFTGTEFTIADAYKAGIANPSAVIAKLREDGFEIYSNPHSRRNDRKVAAGTVNRYRINAKSGRTASRA
jgi:chemotaxis receptor (MCP) glutamine deamidase CheD